MINTITIHRGIFTKSKISLIPANPQKHNTLVHFHKVVSLFLPVSLLQNKLLAGYLFPLLYVLSLFINSCIFLSSQLLPIPKVVNPWIATPNPHPNIGKTNQRNFGEVIRLITTINGITQQ